MGSPVSTSAQVTIASKKMLRFLVPVILSLAAYLYLPKSGSHLLVVLQLSTSTLLPKQLQALGDVKHQLKILRNIDSHMSHLDTSDKEKYNVAIITEHCCDDTAAEFEASLKNMDFIQNYEVFPVSSAPTRQIIGNLGIRVKGLLSYIFPSLAVELHKAVPTPGDPMQKLGEKICSVEERKAVGTMLMINVMKTKDEEAAKRYGDACFSFFPTIGTTIFFIGNARSDYWDTVALIEYESIDSFCTMAQSAEWRSVHHFKVDGYADTHTYMTTPMWTVQHSR